MKTNTKNPIPVIARGKAQIQKAHVTGKVFPLELLKHKLFELSPMLLLLAHWLLLVLTQLFVGTMFSWRNGLAVSGAMKLPSANKKWRACMYGGDFSPQTFSKSTFPPAIKRKENDNIENINSTEQAWNHCRQLFVSSYTKYKQLSTTFLEQQQQQQHKLYYQIKVKLNLQYNILIQKKVTFTQNNWKANRAE